MVTVGVAAAAALSPNELLLASREAEGLMCEVAISALAGGDEVHEDALSDLSDYTSLAEDARPRSSCDSRALNASHGGGSSRDRLSHSSERSHASGASTVVGLSRVGQTVMAAHSAAAAAALAEQQTAMACFDLL